MDTEKLREGNKPDKDVTPETTQLYEVDIGNGGCTWWVSARDPLDALLVVAEHGGYSDMPWDDCIAVEAVHPYRAQGMAFHGLDGEDRTMWEEYNRDRSRRQVACSEW